jgi:hypothetical protein
MCVMSPRAHRQPTRSLSMKPTCLATTSSTMNGVLAGVSPRKEVFTLTCLITRFPNPPPLRTSRTSPGLILSIPPVLNGLHERAKYVAEEQGELVILGGLAAGFIELTAWTRGFARFYPDLITNLDWLTYLMDTIIDLKMAYSIISAKTWLA